MEEENDFIKLSIEDRCQHKLWKARLSGYEEANKLFLQQDDEKSPEFSKYLGLLKKFVIDSNAVAQEKGLSAVLSFVSNAAVAPKTANDLMSGLVSKCFSSSRAKTKELALEITLMYIEIEKQDVVMEELIKGLENKSPKVVAACIIAIRESLHLFGSKVIAIKPLIKVVTKLLEDRDKSVRDESKLLCAEMHRWVGDAIKNLLQSLKPVTLTELEGEFQKSANERVIATRYLKSQQEKIAKAKEEGAKTDSCDSAVDEVLPQVDAYDLMISEDVLSKLPQNFYEQCEAKAWQDRKEILEKLLQMTANVKLESGDYGDLVRALQKLIVEDSNIFIVSLATKCLTNLVLGLRKKFQPYASACIPAIFEKFKEKKQNVVVSLREAIDALYSISTLDAMLEDIQTALSNKNPQVKAETCAFLTRCFCSCSPAHLNKKLLKAFTIVLLKTLNEPDSAVRENSAEAIGTALKVVGEKVMEPFLRDIDPLKMAKIKEFCDKAVVMAKPHGAENKPASAPVKPVAHKSEESVPKPMSETKEPFAESLESKIETALLTAEKFACKCSYSKGKLAAKSPVSEKEKKEIDISPTLRVNNLKDRRLLDEKVLKRNFTPPSEEFNLHLKEQMIAANWNKALISDCFHNDFQFHFEAVDLLAESLENGVEASVSNLDLILKWMALRFFDTNPNVLVDILDYLEKLFQALSIINYRLLEPEASFFIPYLILKMENSKNSCKVVREILKHIVKIYPSSNMFSLIRQGALRA